MPIQIILDVIVHSEIQYDTYFVFTTIGLFKLFITACDVWVINDDNFTELDNLCSKNSNRRQMQRVDYQKGL